MYKKRKVHIISDLNLEILDHALEQHIIDTDVEYIIVAGNISASPKRTMLFAESVAKIFPDTFVIFNYGYLELKLIEYYKVKTAFTTRLRTAKQSLKNLYFPKGEIVGDYDFFCTEGFPYLTRQEFETSQFACNFVIKFDAELYIGERLVSKMQHRYFDYEYYNNLHLEEHEQLKSWLHSDQQKLKILITGSDIIPIQNNNIDLTWISTGEQCKDVQINLLRHITQPGIDRSKYFHI